MNRNKSTKSRFIRRKMIACRIRLGMTQQEVADKANIARTYYTQIENGKVMPSIFVLQSIGEALKTDWKEIVDIQEVEN